MMANGKIGNAPKSDSNQAGYRGIWRAAGLLSALLCIVLAPSVAQADRAADCPSGYTNNGLTCGRGAHSYSAGSRVANCPSGYTNMGLFCQKTPPFGKTLSSGSMSCPSGYFLNKNLGRCYTKCKSGYTNTGETCFRPVSTLGVDSMTCRADEVKNGARCYTPKRYGESCAAWAPCGKGLSCQPGVQKCYDVPRKAGQPCVAGHGCGAGLYCQSFTQQCVPKSIDYNSNSPCGSLRLQATAEDAKRAGLTMSFGVGSAGGVGAFGSLETGLVYGDQGEFGCYITACFGSSSDVSIQSFANFGIFDDYDDFEGFSMVSGGGAETPFAELGFQTSQVWSTRTPRSAKDFAKNQLIGTASGLSFGVGLNPVSVDFAGCLTEVLDDDEPLSTFRDIESALEDWAEDGFDPGQIPNRVANLRSNR